MAKMSRSEVLRHIGGSPDRIGAELAAFSGAAAVLSSDRPRLIETSPMQWVGVFNGAVAATAPDLDCLMTKLNEAGAPPSHTIVRFIDKAEKTFLF